MPSASRRRHARSRRHSHTRNLARCRERNSRTPQNLRDVATIDSNGSVPFTGEINVARADCLGELFTGYGARPYRAITSFVRLLYRF